MWKSENVATMFLAAALTMMSLVALGYSDSEVAIWGCLIMSTLYRLISIVEKGQVNQNSEVSDE